MGVGIKAQPVDGSVRTRVQGSVLLQQGTFCFCPFLFLFKAIQKFDSESLKKDRSSPLSQQPCKESINIFIKQTRKPKAIKVKELAQSLTARS